MATSLSAESISKLNERFGAGRAYREGLGDLINDALSTAAGDIALAEAHILVGNASNVAVDVALTGDIAIDNAGVSSIASGVIVNADVSGSAAIAFSKLAALPSAQILVGNGSNVAAAVAVSGAIALSNAGVSSIANDAVSLEHLDSGIEPSHVVKYAGSFTTAGGDAAEQISVPGVLGTDLAFVVLHTKGATPRTLLTAQAATDAINLEFSDDPSTDHVVKYQVLRAAS